jgi:pilus assembly protein CpaE
MTTYILDSNTSAPSKLVVKKIRSAIPDLQAISSLDEVPQENETARLGRIVIIAPFATIEGIEKLANQFHHRFFFVLVSKEISASDYKRLIRLGSADWISADAPVQEVVETISRQKSSQSEVGSSAKKPTVLSFLPSAGGVGNTTIALEVALHHKLAKPSRSQRACYVDLDFQTSHVCDFLDLEPRFQIQEILDRPERLDQQLFELFANHHSSGLDIFATPRSQLDLCSVNLSSLDLFLGMISRNYDFIVIDLPVTWLRWTVPVLVNSEAIIVTGFNTIPGLRQLKNTVEAAMGVKRAETEISVVVNRVTHNLFGKIERRSHADRVLAGQKLFFLREDPDTVNRLNTGTSAAQSGSGRSVKDFATIAAYCSGLTTRQGQTQK